MGVNCRRYRMHSAIDLLGQYHSKSCDQYVDLGAMGLLGTPGSYCHYSLAGDLYSLAAFPPAIIACSFGGTSERILARISRDLGKVDSA